MGAPIRIHLPWKYGFKSVKSIVRFSFVEEQPLNFWQEINSGEYSGEYGFWANVNPAVPHPRWSQESERDITTNERIPTEIFNGYGDYVAAMYAGLENEPLYM
jgi:sulfoxide reductase catalytic subunit YedY